MNHRKFKNYRLFGYDYTQLGEYFVTICTKDRFHYFGQIKDGQMILNKFGKIALKTTKNIPQHFDVQISKYVVMPNHVHMIVEIRDTCSNAACCDSTTEKKSLLSPKSLSIIIRSFKAQTTKEIKSQGSAQFAWQPRFYDHIIRNEQSYKKIEEYIELNPQKWEHDLFYGKGEW